MSKTLRTIVFAALCFTVPCAAMADWLLPRNNAELNPVIQSPIRNFQWRYPIPGGSSATPVIDGDTVYVAANNDNLYALHLYTGTLEWTQDVGNQFLSAPIIDHGILIGSTGNVKRTGHDVIGSGISSVVGLDALSGKQVWWYGLNGSGAASGAVVDGRYIHHDGAGDIVALDPRNGAAFWKLHAGPHAGLSAITPISESLFVTSGSAPNVVLAVNAVTGRTLWRKIFPTSCAGIGEVPLATDTHAVYGTYLVRRNGIWAEHIYALSVSDGHMLWNTALQGDASAGALGTGAIPLIDNTRLYVGNPLSPYMNAISKETGKLLWSTHLSAPSEGGATLKDDVLYFGDDGGDLWALQANSGKALGYIGVGDPFDRAAPTIVGETLLISSRSGYVIAQPLRTIRESTSSVP